MDLLDDSSSTSSLEEEEEDRVTIIQPNNTDKPSEPVTRKARKILSLAAVLPQKILEELTQSQVQGDNQDSSEDEDNDDEDRNRSRKRPISKDGISNFLSDLKSVRPAVQGNVLTRESRASRTISQPLGAAFLQTTTVVQKGNAVRNIHEENSLLETNQKEDEKTGDCSFRSESQFDTTIKRLSSIRPVVQSAPRVTDGLDSSLSAATPDWSGMSTSASNRIEPPSMHADDPHEANRKRSRREMENALRKGDFQQLDGNVTHLEQARPDSFVPDPETYAVPHHGIRVVPTAMYDPKAGTATNLAAGKGRGKNQIHHLMASAANLELQRARGMAGTSNSSSHRANAKQKYGW